MDPRFDAFLSHIEAFLAESGMAESTFGLRAVKDGKLLERLRSQGNVTTRTMRRVDDFIALQRARAHYRARPAKSTGARCPPI